MATDDGKNLLEPGETPHDNLQFLFFCPAVIQAVDKQQGLFRASVAWPGQDHRLGANGAPPAVISIFLGAELERVFGRDRARRGQRVDAAVVPRPRRARCCRRADARRRSHRAAHRVHRQRVRVPGTRLRHVAVAPDTGERDRGRGDRLPLGEADDTLQAGESVEKALRRSSSAATRTTSRSSSAATTTRRIGTSRPIAAACSTCRLRRTRCHTSSAMRRSRCSPTTACCRSASCTPVRRVPRAVRHQDQHRVGDRLVDRQDAAVAGRGSLPGAAAVGPAAGAGERAQS